MTRWAIYSPYSQLIDEATMAATCHFFIGKGGVGKSTTSALTALRLAQSGRLTLLVSLDPAHNQRDIFGQPFSEKPMTVCAGLAVKEIDMNQWSNAYLNKSIHLLKEAYAYQSALNIQQYFNVLKFSPGLEEYALLLAFDATLANGKAWDDILFDMPPTALTLRFFSLPVITQLWLRELMALRTKIYAKKKIVSKIKWKSIEIEQDKVKTRLQSLIEDSRQQHAYLTSGANHINLVLNNDPLACSEAVRICQRLNDIDMTITRVILNKYEHGEAAITRDPILGAYPMWWFPISKTPLTGIKALERYLQRHPGAVAAYDTRAA
jgi:arsenite-transporting ATPase